MSEGNCQIINFTGRKNGYSVPISFFLFRKNVKRTVRLSSHSTNIAENLSRIHFFFSVRMSKEQSVLSSHSTNIAENLSRIHFFFSVRMSKEQSIYQVIRQTLRKIYPGFMMNPTKPKNLLIYENNRERERKISNVGRIK